MMEPKANRNYPVILVITILMILQGIDIARAEPVNAIYVNTSDDELNSDQDCSLREAITAANQNIQVDECVSGSSETPDDIYLEAKTYSLSIAGIGDNLNLSGDLDLRSSMNIHGTGVGSTIIDGNGIDRVFHLVVDAIEVSIEGLTIQNGAVPSGAEGGGGILQYNGTILSISDCRVTNNHTPVSLGGGFDNWAGQLSITNCSIDNNSAKEGGGIYNDGILTISNSLLDENIGSEQGGGLKNKEPGQATLENVTLSRNSSNGGSGIFSNFPITLRNVSMVKNVGPGVGFANNDVANLKNTIIAFNSDISNCSGDEADFNSEGHNLEDGDSCHLNPAGQQDQINTDPVLVGTMPQDNGGPTRTFALGFTSPAIDSGADIGCPSVDQRGYARPVDGDGDGDAFCDIGAYEGETPLFHYFPFVNK